jgi:hypothetical protein
MAALLLGLVLLSASDTVLMHDALPKILHLGGQSSVLLVYGLGFRSFQRLALNVSFPGREGPFSLRRSRRALNFSFPAQVMNSTLLSISLHLNSTLLRGSAATAAVVSFAQTNLLSMGKFEHSRIALLFVDKTFVDFPPRLNLGCGLDILPRWFNMDSMQLKEPFYDWAIDADQELAGNRNLIRWQFQADALGAFESRSVAAITIAHALRYLEIGTIRSLASEFSRVLQVGGVVRIMEQEAETDSDFGAPKQQWVEALVESGMRVMEVDQYTSHYAEVDAASIRRHVHSVSRESRREARREALLEARLEARLEERVNGRQGVHGNRVGRHRKRGGLFLIEAIQIQREAHQQFHRLSGQQQHQQQHRYRQLQRMRDTWPALHTILHINPNTHANTLTSQPLGQAIGGDLFNRQFLQALAGWGENEIKRPKSSGGRGVGGGDGGNATGSGDSGDGSGSGSGDGSGSGSGDGSGSGSGGDGSGSGAYAYANDGSRRIKDSLLTLAAHALTNDQRSLNSLFKLEQLPRSLPEHELTEWWGGIVSVVIRAPEVEAGTEGEGEFARHRKSGAGEGGGKVMRNGRVQRDAQLELEVVRQLERAKRLCSSLGLGLELGLGLASASASRSRSL